MSDRKIDILFLKRHSFPGNFGRKNWCITLNSYSWWNIEQQIRVNPVIGNDGFTKIMFFFYSYQRWTYFTECAIYHVVCLLLSNGIWSLRLWNVDIRTNIHYRAIDKAKKQTMDNHSRHFQLKQGVIDHINEGSDSFFTAIL